MKKYKTYTLQELAEQYQVTIRTMQNWIKPIRAELLSMNPGENKRLRILLPRQVKRIEEFLG
jgi:transposase